MNADSFSPLNTKNIGINLHGKIFKNMAISRFCHVLETLNRTGVPILESLTISSRSTGNNYVKHKLANI